jgi:site-specific recombinase XerD
MNTVFIPIETIDALRGSPLHPFVERYVALLKQQGYADGTAKLHIRLFVHLQRWLKARGYSDLDKLDELLFEAFLREYSIGRHSHLGAPMALRRFLGVLREAGVTRPAKMPSLPPARRLTDDYRCFLRDQRGCSVLTVGKYGQHVDRFLSQLFGIGPVDMRQITFANVIAFVEGTTSDHGQCFTKQVINAIRSFLRFLHYCGKLKSDWAGSVPRIACWQLAGLPKPLSPDAVLKILDSCDQTTIVGRRDHAILLLLARLGLRPGEIAAMKIDDIDWESARLTVRSNKGRGWARMPLPEDVGKAIARYLRTDRPSSPSRNVFVRIPAPHNPLATSRAVAARATAAMVRVGVKSARKGAHIFRHSLASDMLRQGASLDEIGRVLRHTNVRSTAIYAKVDINALRRLAVPMPGGER